MKKIIIALVSCLVAIAPVFAQNRIVKSFANLRTQSNVNSTVIEIIPRGERVYVVGDLAGGWSQVIYNYMGYVYTSNLISEGNHTYTPTTRIRYYTNSAGQRVQSPTYYPSVPRGATARCVDGTYSLAEIDGEPVRTMAELRSGYNVLFCYYSIIEYINNQTYHNNENQNVYCHGHFDYTCVSGVRPEKSCL